MTNISIPPAALEAGAEIIEKYRISGWTDKMVARTAFLAMLENWPGMWTSNSVGNGSIILPLPQEASND
jgi:hypothetical protein